MRIEIPARSLIVLMGPSGAGKSTFARAHFKPTEVVSSDMCRGLISDDENNQDVTPEAFQLLHEIVGQRLALGRLTVIDATNVWREDRRSYVVLARAHGFALVAVAFDLPINVCAQRNQQRPDRTMGTNVLFSQSTALRKSLPTLEEEGFDQIAVLSSADEARALEVIRLPAVEAVD